MRTDASEFMRRAMAKVSGPLIAMGGKMPRGREPAASGSAATGRAEQASVALVLEDNVVIAMEIEQMLGDFGFSQVHLCGTEQLALEFLESSHVDFAILDVDLGEGATSANVAALLRERTIPFLFASGYEDAFSHGSRKAEEPVVAKPFTTGDIRAALARIGVL